MVKRKIGSSFKKALAVGIAGVLCFSLAACAPTASSSEPEVDAGAINTEPGLGEDGLGTKFSYEVLDPISYDGKEIDLTPNAYSAADKNTDKVVYNGVQFDYDTMSGATVLPSRNLAAKTQMVDPEVKAEKMFWSVQAPLGIIAGEYYYHGEPFNLHENNEQDDDFYLGTADLVVSDGVIRHIEFDEKASPYYYDETWQAQPKRRSGYAFFQQVAVRTDRTLVTWVNGQTFLEWQILRHNSLNPIFDTVYGSSNSPRNAFIPSTKALAEKVATPSGQYYIGISLPIEGGIAPRLQLVYEGTTLVSVRYDEIFADDKADITDEALQEYYRQSKYDSINYTKADNGVFHSWSDELASAFVGQNSLDVNSDSVAALSSQPEFANVKMLIEAVTPTVEKYLAEGYEHNVGTIAERPDGMVERPDQVNRQEDINMTIQSAAFSEDGETLNVDVMVENKSDEAYLLDSRSYYLYTNDKNNNTATVGPTDTKEVEIPAGGSEVISLSIYPIQEGDTGFSLVFDGRNEVYFHIDLGL